jgi:sigma-E factor negative regulatory protein RseA
METKNMTQEQISALLDSELSDAHIEVALAALRHSEGRATWDVYHQIGDVLRSDDMAQAPSKDFMARMMARLDEEPPILAPPVSRQTEQQLAQANGAMFSPRLKRLAFPSAMAAALVCALVFAPQMMKSSKSDVVEPSETVVLPASPGGANSVIATTANSSQQEGTVLRDPRYNQYLLAHQRFSPSWNSTAQYARSATYTVTSDTDK